MIYFGFYTKAYADESRQLVESLRAFDLPHEVIAVPDRGSWQANTQAKAEYIREAMARHRCPLVYLDADARVRRMPDLFGELSCDLAAHWRHGVELLSGTLYLDYSDAARCLVDRWIAVNSLQPKRWDQLNLDDAVALVPSLRVTKLPAAYCQIFDTMAHHGESVIEHMQASRRLRR